MVIARLPNPEINLAAYGGIVYPVALIVESPIIMLLAASVALSRDWASYKKLFRFMMVAGGTMTLVHLIIAFTPVYYFVARQLINLPENVVEPGRLGLMLITPWTWSIAYRRFQQGVLIRSGHSDAVGVGTIIRLEWRSDCADHRLSAGVFTWGRGWGYCPVGWRLERGDLCRDPRAGRY